MSAAPDYQTFPFPQRIFLKGPEGRYDEAVNGYSGTTYGGLLPGMLLQFYQETSGEPWDEEEQNQVLPHGTYGGAFDRWVAIEDSLYAGLISTPYVQGAIVRGFHYMPGCELYMPLQPGVNVTPGTLLMSGGDGTLVPLQSSIIESYTAGPSSAITNTTTETAFAPVGAIPINDMIAGDIFRIRAAGKITGVTGTPTLDVKLKIGNGTDGYLTIADSGAVTVTTGDVFEIQAELTVQTAGAPGTITGSALWDVGTPGTATTKHALLGPGSNIYTTHVNNVIVTVTWSAASASNTVVLDQLDVELSRSLGASNVVGQSLDTFTYSSGSFPQYIRVLTR